MVKKISLMMTLLLLAAAGCSLLGGGGLKPEETVEGDLDAGVELGDIVPDVEEVFLAAGIAVEDDWPAVQFPLAAGEEGISLFVEADDIDPVIVIIDAEMEVLVAGDDWDEELDAFVSLKEVPEGASALVFDATGDDGTFLLETGESETYSWGIAIGDSYELTILEDKENDLWEDLITDVSDIWREDWESSAVVPMHLEEDVFVQIKAESEIDCVMAIFMVDDDELDYVDYDDDTYDMNPGFTGELEQGSYIIVVDTYSDSDDTEITLEVSEMDPEEMNADIVQAYEMDEWYTGVFREGSMVLSYWPEAGDYWGVYPEEQVVVFEFTIDQDGEYVFDAFCVNDTKMAIIDEDAVMIEYNDDGPEGLDPQLVLQLSPGHYAALVTPYSDALNEEVEFMYSMAAPIERERGFVPWDQTGWSDGNIYLSLVFEPGQTYEIFAESDTDLTLTVTDTAGEVYFSDDDGGDFNPWLQVEATMENAGAWDIDVESYGGYGIGDEVRVVARPMREEEEIRETTAPVDL